MDKLSLDSFEACVEINLKQIKETDLQKKGSLEIRNSCVNHDFSKKYYEIESVRNK